MELTQNALLSAYNKKGIVEFARDLINLGWKVYSSKGTIDELRYRRARTTEEGSPHLG